jgi:hypothetical protein
MNKILSYGSCNFGTIISFCIVFSLMLITIIVMKLFIDGEIYNDKHGCWPISFYFGEVNGCKRMIYDTINTDGFQTMTKDTTNGNSVNTEFSYLSIINMIIISILKYLKLFMNEITLFGLYIVETNDLIKSYIYQFVKEKVSFIYIYR